MKALPVLDSKAAGIDVGSEKLHVSIAGDTPKVFGTFTGDLERLRDWFQEQGVHSVAMEATGVYWLYVYEVLEAAGLEVVVVNGRHVQNVPGRKTDMADCQWLATLHAHGLLRGGFVPPADIRQLQDYQRLRADHLIGAASQVQKMQQALERMNLKFHDVISDLVGVSGLKVVRAILRGERRPGELLALCDVQIQKKKADRVKESLRGCWKKEQLFALRQALELWETYQQKIADCDRELEALLREMTGPQPPEGGRGNAVVMGPVALAPAKSPGKNAPVIERLQELVARLCGGRDVTQIPGLSVYLVLQLISEVGTDMARWPSEKHFASWLGLAGGRKQSGKRKGSVKAHRNRAGRMFCAAARALGQSVDKALGGFYRRLRGRLGGLAANVALARNTLETQIALVEKGGGDQSTAGGAMIQLTQEEAEAYTEMERLMSDARRSASLAFPKGDPRLHLEFSVGVQDQPHDLDHELQYANTIVKGCQTYAAQLAEHGWTADDTTALDGYITTLEGDPAVRDTAGDTKKRITSARNSGANDLYKMCLTVQNAARLAYPITQAGKVAGVTEARARFLLDEFPPQRDNSAAPAPTPTPAPTQPAK